MGWADAPRADALAWLPLVGVVIGAVAGALAYAVSFIAPHPVVVAIAFGASIVLSGAIHLDGYLDSCDALFASVPVHRRLEIMKDPRHGTFALAGFAVLAALWLAALGTIPPRELPALLAFAGGVARGMAVFNAFVIPYGAGGTSANAFTQRPNLAVLIVCTSLALACAWRHPVWLAIVPFAAAFAIGGGRFAAMRLGGALVGDCYGAIITALDVAIITVVASLAGASA